MSDFPDANSSTSSRDAARLAHLRAITDALHSNPRALLAGAAMGMVTAVLCAWDTGDPTYAIFAAAIGLVAVARGVLRAAYLRSGDRGRHEGSAAARRLRAWQAATVLAGAAAAFLLGAMSFYAIAGSHGADGGLLAPLAATGVAFANAVGVAGRSFGSPLLVRIQTGSLYGPIAAALLWQATPAFAALALFVILFGFLVVEVSDGQRGVLEGALRGRAESEALSHQLSVALETTPNGVLMFDADGVLQLFNAQAAALLDLAPDARGRLDLGAAEARLRRLLEPTGAWPAGGPLHGHSEARSRAGGTQGRDHRLFEIATRRNAAGDLVVRIDDVTEARQAERRITHLARFDGLTGLANRAWFFSRGEAMLPPAVPSGGAGSQGGHGVCVATLDIDGLRAVNETHGHAVADAVLSELGERLARVGGAERLCARMGGDEFAVLSILGGAQAGSVSELAEELEAALAFTLRTPNGAIAVSGTVGLCHDGGSGLSLDELLERADFAQALAKADPHARSAVFERGMEGTFGRAKRLREDIGPAIAAGAIRTVYQPIWSVATNGPVSFEALARWTHDTFGPVPPDEFVRLAEEAGLVGDLTRLQLDAATRFCAELQGNVAVSVNLSAHDFARDDLAADIAGALARSGLAPHRLVVEVTETSLLELGAATFATFEAIRATGVRIALDDFGTGYSSLSYLQRLDLDIVKVDRAFLASLHENRRTASVLAAVARLAEGLDMAVVVEGVETPEQMETLTADLGFDLLQGYLYGAPMPATAARTLLERSRPGTAGAKMNETGTNEAGTNEKSVDSLQL